MKTLRLILISFGFAAGCVPAVLAAAPMRLFEIAVTRFTRTDDGRAKLELGHLRANAQFRAAESFSVAVPPGMPEAAWGKAVISSEAWTAYQALGAQAVANFERVNHGQPHVIAGIPHYEVEASPSANLNVAPVINLSTRGRLTAGTVPSLIGGFVVEGEPGLTRHVLIRAIGPGLAAFGVTDAAPDPYVSLTKRTTTFSFNDNWSGRADADEIERVAAQVGAFPLARGSRDAAILAELTPGDYTASVVTEGASAGGTALLEIYILP